MLSLPFQTILPFLLSAIVVIIIMYIAEKHGTKIGGILGTLPTTIVVALLFISLNRGVEFASKSAAIIPAELGINILFLLTFSILIHRSVLLAFAASITIWGILSSILLYVELENIYISLGIYIISLLITIILLEGIKKIPSTGNVVVKYTPKKIALRGILAGAVISTAVLLSNIGAAICGIFTVFPVILLSTMLISVHEHGPDFAAGMAKSMTIGITSILCYVVATHFLYPIYGIVSGSLVAYSISFVFTMIIFRLRSKII